MSAFKTKQQKIIENAREEAIIKAPTEYGFFDAEMRVDAFVSTCLGQNFIVFLGSIKDKDVDYLIKKYFLDRE